MLERAIHAMPALLLATLALTGAAAAQEVCVSCTDPDVTYKCTIKDAEKAGHIRGAGKAIEFLCISELARSGGHRSCLASREFVGACIGQPRLIDITRPAEPDGRAGIQAATGAEPTTDTGGPSARAANQPPRTLEELARESAAKSSKQLENADLKVLQAAKDAASNAGKSLDKAGAAVGDAVQKTGAAVGDAVKKTGSVVGDAVQKSGDAVKKGVVCVVTLFTSCGKEPAEKRPE